jgi:hypothetical protein
MGTEHRLQPVLRWQSAASPQAFSDQHTAVSQHDAAASPMIAGQPDALPALTEELLSLTSAHAIWDTA